jgi:hypothetical protein
MSQRGVPGDAPSRLQLVLDHDMILAPATEIKHGVRRAEARSFHPVHANSGV